MSDPGPTTYPMLLTCQNCGSMLRRSLPYNLEAPDSCENCGASLRQDPGEEIGMGMLGHGPLADRARSTEIGERFTVERIGERKIRITRG